MPPIIYDGKKVAADRLVTLHQSIAKAAQPAHIISVLFSEDEGSVLYTRLKKNAAIKAGFSFTQEEFTIRRGTAAAISAIRRISAGPSHTGLIVQKPTQAVWQKHYTGQDDFDTWWQHLVNPLPADKDIDCLSPTNLANIRTGRWTILPATVKAVLITLESALHISDLCTACDHPELGHLTASIIGCSDIIGSPLAHTLKRFGLRVNLMCRQTDQSLLLKSNIIISATGCPNVVTGDMVSPGTIVIDIGAPHADVEFASVAPKASFITPVPGGVGPLTVVSLLENTAALLQPAVFQH